MMLQIWVKKIHENAVIPQKIAEGDWIDLYTVSDVQLKQHQSFLIPLGLCMKLPKEYEAIIAPRSSTFPKWGILQTNSIGVIDESYCGPLDEWKLPVLATRDVLIPAGTKICQFRILKHMDSIEFIEVSEMLDSDRGGFGSTDLKRGFCKWH